MDVFLIESDGQKDENPLVFDSFDNAIAYGCLNSNKTFKICDDKVEHQYIKNRYDKIWKLYSETNSKLKPSLKPPLGLIPRSIAETTRATDVKEAISRYLENGMEIPIEWIEEHNEWIRKNKR